MTQTEKAIQEVKVTIAGHEEMLAGIRDDADDIWSDVEKSNESIDKLRDRMSDLQSQVAVLSAGIDDFKKRWDESDRRRWTIYGVMLAAALTFIANLALLLLRK